MRRKKLKPTLKSIYHSTKYQPKVMLKRINPELYFGAQNSNIAKEVASSAVPIGKVLPLPPQRRISLGIMEADKMRHFLDNAVPTTNPQSSGNLGDNMPSVGQGIKTHLTVKKLIERKARMQSRTMSSGNNQGLTDLQTGLILLPRPSSCPPITSETHTSKQTSYEEDGFLNSADDASSREGSPEDSSSSRLWPTPRIVSVSSMAVPDKEAKLKVRKQLVQNQEKSGLDKNQINPSNDGKQERTFTNEKAEKSRMDGKVEKSRTDGKAEKPRTDGKAEKPRTDGKAEKPRVNGKAEKPRVNGKAEKPGADGKAEKPDADRKAEKPDADRKAEKLRTDGKVEKSRTGGKLEKVLTSEKPDKLDVKLGKSRIDEKLEKSRVSGKSVKTRSSDKQEISHTDGKQEISRTDGKQEKSRTARRVEKSHTDEKAVKYQKDVKQEKTRTDVSHMTPPIKGPLKRPLTSPSPGPPPKQMRVADIADEVAQQADGPQPARLGFWDRARKMAGMRSSLLRLQAVCTQVFKSVADRDAKIRELENKTQGMDTPQCDPRCVALQDTLTKLGISEDLFVKLSRIVSDSRPGSEFNNPKAAAIMTMIHEYKPSY